MGNRIWKWWRVLGPVALCAFGAAPAAFAGSRIKDLVDVEGVRGNYLVGYGLVVGLQGTGDSLRNSVFTKQSLEAMLEQFGVNAKNAGLNTRNVAAVIVTANLPPFAMQGSRIDVTVSALGDSKSLAGGQLLVTPLLGAGDNKVYAVAQGPLVLGGFSAEGGSGSSVTQGVPTRARISNGALIERELQFDLAGQRTARLALRNPDLTTATRIADAINRVAPGAARAISSGMVSLNRPGNYSGDMMKLLVEIERLEVEPDRAAKIIVDESSGIIVMGEDVRVSTAAIAHGNLTISIQETPIVSQPAPLSDGKTVTLPRSDVAVEEEKGGLAVVKGGVPLRQLVDGLNALGVSPRDMITILQSLKASGAIQAELEVI